MNLVTSILAISIAIVLYFALIEIFTALFRITCLTKEKARFQAISMITCVGFTTGEAEIITLNRRRRKLAIACMITGNLFNVLIISLIINLISNISSEGLIADQLMWIFIIVGSVLLIIILSKIPSFFNPRRMAGLSNFSFLSCFTFKVYTLENLGHKRKMRFISEIITQWLPIKISLNTKHSPGCRGELGMKEKVIISYF